MAIGNVAIVTVGWYSSVAADTPGSIPDGEEIHGWGWIDGTIAPSITTSIVGHNPMRYFIFIPKRRKYAR